MRSLLFVPGDSEKKLEKALASGADVLIVDLEDSVAGARKDAARDIAADFIKKSRKKTSAKLYVRVNDFDSGMTDGDLEVDDQHIGAARQRLLQLLLRVAWDEQQRAHQAAAFFTIIA